MVDVGRSPRRVLISGAGPRASGSANSRQEAETANRGVWVTAALYRLIFVVVEANIKGTWADDGRRRMGSRGKYLNTSLYGPELKHISGKPMCETSTVPELAGAETTYFLVQR